MKIISSIFLVLVGSVSIILLGFAQPASNPIQADNQFAFDLYSRLTSNRGNVFFSPYSLSCALSMAYEGARGETAQEMSSVLRLNADDADRRAETSAFIQQINRADKAYELSVANALWAQKAYPFKDDYLNLIKNIYFAEGRNLDFSSSQESSRVTINGWVSEHTQNRITDLLPAGSIKSDTRLILTDAVYFKDRWETPFKKVNTKPDTFWLSPDQSVQNDMMMLRAKSFNYSENEHVQILDLPYQGEDISMLIILPREKDIQVIEKTINESILKQWDETMNKQPVNVYIPKFKFETGYQMKDILEGMGMKNAFDGSADFSGMTGHKDLYIDQVFHKAWIDVDEEGTEAAAATTIGMKRMAMMVEPLQPKVFRADHPFIFVIRENRTGHILFMGRVSDPREKTGTQ